MILDMVYIARGGWGPILKTATIAIVCPAGLGPEQRYKASRVDMIRSRLRGMS